MKIDDSLVTVKDWKVKRLPNNDELVISVIFKDGRIDFYLAILKDETIEKPTFRMFPFKCKNIREARDYFEKEFPEKIVIID